MNRKYYLLILLICVLFTSCNQDKVDSLNFDVTVRDDVQEIYVGDEVSFDFFGNPDYIVFYSGEDGNNYANKDRLKVNVESMSLSYTIKQQYTEIAYQNRAIMEIYLSEDFNGDYTADGISKATWIKLSGIEEGKLKVPTCPNMRNETVSDEVDFSLYKDKKFYLAFRYQTPEVSDIDKGQPRVDVQPLALTKKIEGGTIAMTNPAKEFGFNYVFVKSKSQNNFGPNDTGLLFQPQNAIGTEIDIWAVSQQVDASSVAPDQGKTIKSLDMQSSSYSYRYTSPGVYNVTFVALNANMWNSESVVKEFKIIVKEKSL